MKVFDNIFNNKVKKIDKKTEEEKQKLKDFIDKEYQILDEFKVKISNAYIICGIILLLLVSFGVGLFIARVFILWIILYIVFASIFFLFTFAVLVIRLILDRKRIKDFITLKLSKGILRITIFKPERKTAIFYVNVSKDYFEFENGEYFVNEKCIWVDENGIPNSYYFYNIPNPLMFNFRANILRYMEYFKAKTSGLNPEKVFQDGFEIELGYNSENVKLLRQDNFINQLHGSSTLGLKDILLYILFIIVIILQFVILFKQPVAVETPVKETVKQSILFLILLIKIRGNKNE